MNRQTATMNETMNENKNGNENGHETGHEIGTPDGDPAPEAVGRTRLREALAGLWTGFSYGFFGLVLLLAAVVILVPRLAGGIPLTVLTNSMEPTLPVGSLAVVLPIEPEDVRLGDVVTYLPNPDDPTAVTHRVIGINHHDDGTRTFTFKGDNNTEADAPVRDYQVRAKVWYSVPLLGHLSLAVNGAHRSPVVLAVASVFFVWAARIWWRAGRDRREARRLVAAIEADLS